MKVAVITGASRGIGKAVAKGLAEDGYHLSLSARSKKALLSTKEEIESFHQKNEGMIECYECDVTSRDDVRAMVADTISTFGRIDLLLNNAGIFYHGTSDLDYEQFEEMVRINLLAAFNVAKEIIPIMKKQKSGTIINVSSRSGKMAKAHSGGYAATKFGLVGLSESLYRELASEGIRVTALCPGWVDTDMSSSSGLAPQETIQTDDIVKTVRWLSSLSPSACVPDVLIESIRQVKPLR